MWNAECDLNLGGFENNVLPASCRQIKTQIVQIDSCGNVSHSRNLPQSLCVCNQRSKINEPLLCRK